MPADTTSTIRVWIYASVSAGDGPPGLGLEVFGSKDEAIEAALRELADDEENMDGLDEDDYIRSLRKWAIQVRKWNGREVIKYEHTDYEVQELRQLRTETFQISDRVLARMIG